MRRKGLPEKTDLFVETELNVPIMCEVSGDTLIEMNHIKAHNHKKYGDITTDGVNF